MAATANIDVEMWPIARPKPYSGNPRVNDAAVDAVANSIREFGWRAPIVVDEQDVVLAGHTRLKAALKLGLTEVPVHVAVGLSADQAKAFRIADNQTASIAEWDEGKLIEELLALKASDYDLSLMGFDEGELLRMLTPEPELAGDLDDVPEAPEVAITQPGDLWLLGQHRLLCGDSSNPSEVARLMIGEKAFLMSTDPPYGVDFAGAKYNPNAKEWDAIVNDKLQGSDLQDFIASVINAWLPHLSKQAGFYFWTAAMQQGAAAATAIKSTGLHIQSQILWNKNCLVLGQADSHWKHENCWYAFWKGEKHRWFGERDKTTVWEVKKVSNSDYVHPMQKPVELYLIPIQNHTQLGEVICEPFSGSGSQFIAAEQLGRKCYGMEISQIYCDVIVKRWEQVTGKKATLEEKFDARPQAEADQGEGATREPRKAQAKRKRA